LLPCSLLFMLPRLRSSSGPLLGRLTCIVRHQEDLLSNVEQLKALNFHDSTLVVVSIQFSTGNEKSCEVVLDYYDWEGNAQRRTLDSKSQWLSKRLSITFGYLAHFEFSAPDLVNRAQDIDHLEVGYELPRFLGLRNKFKHEFPRGTYPLFDDGSEVVSLRFITQNSDDESEGFLWLVGSKVQLSWSASVNVEGQHHFPIADA